MALSTKMIDWAIIVKLSLNDPISSSIYSKNSDYGTFCPSERYIGLVAALLYVVLPNSYNVPLNPETRLCWAGVDLLLDAIYVGIGYDAEFRLLLLLSPFCVYVCVSTFDFVLMVFSWIDALVSLKLELILGSFGSIIT